MRRVIDKYRRLHETDLGCLLVASGFFLLAVVVITLILYNG
ncbi:MAG TPA: hypothetical protein VER32_07570 [Pyrinomonadaceae bacterium]|nr:hypothetical protein [Pyrinomonadaceae bacterium]